MRSKRATATMVAISVGLAVAGTAAPAHAAKPSWAGKPMVERLPVVQSDPPTFRCGARTIRFTSGSVIFQFRELPRGRFLGLIKLRGARASDGTTSYAARGGGLIRGSKDRGTFRVSITFVARGGNVERVNTTVTQTRQGESVVHRGSCMVIGL